MAYGQEFAELKWLQAHPEFAMRPATIREFIGPGYLDDDKVRPGVLAGLVEVFGEEVSGDMLSRVRRAVFTGAIGIGKTTFASIALTYMLHWVKCLKDPQEYYGLMKGTVISLMLMSTSMKLAQEVTFGAVKARINNSDWFKQYCPVINEKMTTQMRFPGDIWIVPGTSEETSFEGHNILAGIIDEGDSHKITGKKDYAEAAYDTINSRIASRYPDFYAGDHRGLMIVIGQMKSKSGFMMRKYLEFTEDPAANSMRMSLWESFGWHMFTKDKGDIERGIETSERDSFYFDTRRKKLLTKEAAQLIMNKDLIEVPKVYEKQFQNDPVKALRDLAGIPPEADDPFISQTDRIIDCQEGWKDAYGESPVGIEFTLDDIVLPKLFKPYDDFKRVIHIDTAYSADGDALGFAMGHVPYKRTIFDEERPVIVFDMLMRLKARSGTQIDFGQLREFIYGLTERGFDISMISMDGFNTADMIQQLKKKKYKVQYVSVDKTKGPYEDLREAINDRRCLHPALMSLPSITDTKPINIAYKELSELSDTGRKIDHPPLGSKDVADAMAGVVYELMNNKKYQRAARTQEEGEQKDWAGENYTKDTLEQFLQPGDPDMAPVVTFEEFARDQAKYMSEGVPGVNFDFMSDGPSAFKPFGTERTL
jgi:hypothetical protein